MPDLTVTGYVTRDELSLPDLALNDATYRIIRDTTGPGEVVWDRQVTTSPYVHGEMLVNAVRQVVTTPLGIRVVGSSGSDCQTKVATLIRAFEQFSYELSITVEGVEWRWACEPADYMIGDGGTFQSFHLMSNRQEVRFIIPRDPIPLAGPA